MKRIFLILAILAMAATAFAGDDVYKDRVLSINAPARKAVAVTPSDTADLASVPRSLFIGVDGDIAVIMADDTASVILKNATGMLPIMVKRVLATGTTATNIIAVY
jgi:hypothetical protein